MTRIVFDTNAIVSATLVIDEMKVLRKKIDRYWKMMGYW